jgi:hypothetical protein
VVDYRDLTGTPRSTVQDIYRALDMPLSDSYDQFLQSQEEREKGHKSNFEYSIDDYEVSRQRIESELYDFYDVYSWPRANSTAPVDEQVRS